jgi:hypothetical protein
LNGTAAYPHPALRATFSRKREKGFLVADQRCSAILPRRI